MDSILLPTDFSADSELAFHIACGIARDRIIKLILLHVLDQHKLSPDEYHDDEINHDSALYESCSNEFERLKKFADGIPLSLHLKVGSCVETIVRVAKEEHCAMIVIAAHRHCHLHRAMYGSVSEGLANQAQCPVACVNHPPFQSMTASLLDGLRTKLHARPAMWPRQ